MLSLFPHLVLQVLLDVVSVTSLCPSLPPFWICYILAFLNHGKLPECVSYLLLHNKPHKNSGSQWQPLFGGGSGCGLTGSARWFFCQLLLNLSRGCGQWWWGLDTSGSSAQALRRLGLSSEQWELSLHTVSVRSFSTWLLPYSQGGSSSFFWEARCGHRVPTTEHHTEDSAGYVSDFSLIMVLWLIRSVWPLSLLWIALINPGRSAHFLLSALNIEFGLVATFSPARLSCPS